jgi:hypothetical protein
MMHYVKLKALLKLYHKNLMIVKELMDELTFGFKPYILLININEV